MDLELFRRDRIIDPAELDVAAIEQADRFFYWAERAARARVVLDRTKLQVDLAESRLTIECRKEPSKFGIGKITDATVGHAVHNHPDYKAVCDLHLEAREEYLLLDAAVEAMEQRKRMIEILVTLHGQQYFAGPKVPRDLVAAWGSRAGVALGPRDTQDEVNEAQRARARRRS